MKWGDFEIHVLSAGTMRLDGGAMFGVVPRVMWEKVAPPDERNRIRLGLNCLLVRSSAGNLLIDTGCGSKLSDREISIYQLQQEPGLEAELGRCGLSADQIDVVVNTHLHFDHAGGNTSRVGTGVLPAFPRARYLVQRRELADAESANERTRASYFPDNWRPLAESGQLEMLDGAAQVLPGVYCEPTPGHTAGHQCVRLESGGRTLYYIADLCPTLAHVPLPWIMGYDLYPLTTLETRREVYRRAVAEDWLICFEHDPDHPWGRITVRDGKYTGAVEEL